jgi:SWI/SNF-related matrix-associated actin-dependent regulator 1 of chromatin subfamily A
MLFKGKTKSECLATLSTNSSNIPVIKLTFPRDIQTIRNVKGVVGCKFYNRNQTEYWTVPLLKSVVSQLTEFGFTINPEIRSALETYVETPCIKIPGLNGQLYPFQSQGVEFLESRNGRALIADEMGLGKTIQAIAYAQRHPEIRPILIVCPAALKYNWDQEIGKWMTIKKETGVLFGTTPFFVDKNIVIINYDIVQDWLFVLKQMDFQLLILDECHRIKNNAAGRTSAIKKLAKKIPHIIALSGTPIINRPIEIYNAVSLIDSTVIPPFWEFAERFCDAKHTRHGWNFNGSAHTKELHQLLTSTVMIRRLKKDVLKDLPDKTFHFTPIELSNRAEYDRAEKNFLRYVKDTKGQEAAIRSSRAEALSKINTLKQLAVKGKMKQVIEWIETFLESGEKLVVYAWHRETIDMLVSAFPTISVKIDGRTPANQSTQIVKQFQTDPSIVLFIGQMESAGEGITLTASSTIAILELPWTPKNIKQPIDRLHRIGQKEAVMVHYLLARGTVEEDIAGLLDQKVKIADAILDGVDTEEEDLLYALINKYYKK